MQHHQETALDIIGATIASLEEARKHLETGNRETAASALWKARGSVDYVTRVLPGDPERPTAQREAFRSPGVRPGFETFHEYLDRTQPAILDGMPGLQAAWDAMPARFTPDCFVHELGPEYGDITEPVGPATWPKPS